MHSHCNLSSDKIEFKGHTKQVSELVLQLKQLGWQGGIILQAKGLSVIAKYFSLQIHYFLSSNNDELIGHTQFLDSASNCKKEGQIHYLF